MIIKKKQAQTLLEAFPDSSLEKSDNAISNAKEHNDPYQSVASEDFEVGRMQDRRRKDRRSGYRRMGDQEIISLAYEEANAIKEAAAQEGFAAGIEESRIACQSLQKAIIDLMNAKEEALASAAEELYAMAIEIAENIIKTEVSCDETLVMSIVRKTVAKVGREQKSILIKVNPVDLKVVKETMKTDSQLSESVEVLVVEDTEIDPGSCIVETRAGQIDARFSTQLEILKQLLMIGGKF